LNFRDKVARGNSVLYLQDLETKCASHDGIIFALKKFTGGMGDEDETQPDDNFVWMKYFLKPVSYHLNVNFDNHIFLQSLKLFILPESGISKLTKIYQINFDNQCSREQFFTENIVLLFYSTFFSLGRFCTEGCLHQEGQRRGGTPERQVRTTNAKTIKKLSFGLFSTSHLV
jgi:hypothetical protein